MSSTSYLPSLRNLHYSSGNSRWMSAKLDSLAKVARNLTTINLMCLDPNKLPHIHRDMIPHFLRRYLAPEFFTHTLNACNSLNHFALSCPRTTHELVCGKFVISNLVRSGIALRLQSLVLNTIGRLKDHTEAMGA